MSARFFLDTNIFVYCFDRHARRKAESAQAIVKDAVQSGQGVVSYQVVQEFLNVALRKFAVPLAAAEATEYVSTVFRPLLAVHSSESLILDALHLCGRYSTSWYDSLIVAAAVQAECSVLYSEDLDPGLRIGPMRIVNPFAA